MQTRHGGRRYEWDPAKALSNEKKHGVTFDEGISAFNDPMLILEFDPEHSGPDEERWYVIGISRNLRIVTVVFTLRSHGDEEETTRIISARRADHEETARYEVRFRHDG